MSIAFRLAASVMLASLASGVACSATSGSGDSGLDSGSGGSGSGSGAGPSSGGTIGLGATAGSGGTVSVGGGSTGGGCQQFEISWAPKIPTVYLVVDRSGSMFDPLPGDTTAWATLRTGALEVISDLQAEVRFGFAAYSAYPGATPGVACPLQPSQAVDLPTQAPELNNHEGIAGVYNGLEKPPSDKINTGSSYALAAVADLLWADTAEGEKYILFVTDGEPDYCDDPHRPCPIDSVVWTLQRLRAGLDAAGGTHPPISTIVLGLATSVTPLAEQALLQFANAGAGEGVPWLVDPDSSMPYTKDRTYYECQPVPGWSADFTASGKAVTDSLGTYAAAAGAGQPFQPNPADQAAISEKIREALAGVKSCTFDISEGNIEIDWQRADLATAAGVQINAEAVAYDATNGWHMTSATQVELSGEACTKWRAPGETSIHFDFPCDLIVPK